MTLHDAIAWFAIVVSACTLFAVSIAWGHDEEVATPIGGAKIYFYPIPSTDCPKCGHKLCLLCVRMSNGYSNGVSLVAIQDWVLNCHRCGHSMPQDWLSAMSI